MIYRNFFAICLCLMVAAPLSAQLGRDARFEILRTIIAEQGAARIVLPFGSDGVELSDAGQINKEKLDKDLKKNGQSVEIGRVVTITDLEFSDNRIEIELDGGGKNKKSFLDRIQVGVGTGNTTVPVSRDDKTQKAKGSKIILRFAKKVPEGLTPDQLRELLNPILDFSSPQIVKTGLESLPPEFQEAVKAKEARIGMDKNTVIMALGRPNRRTYEGGVEDWIYNGRGNRVQFIKFEDGVVVQIKEYGLSSSSKE
jgi:hypothetical protein